MFCLLQERINAIRAMNETRKDEEHLQVVEAFHELRLASIRGNLEGVKNTLHKGNFTEYTHG